MTPRTRSLFSRWSGWLAVLLLLSVFTPARAQDTDDLPVVTRTLAITNARVVQAPGQVLEGATIIVRDGLIEAIGSDVDIPFDARRVAGDSLTVYAGFVDGLSHTGVDTPDLDTSEDIENPDTAPPARAGIQPDRLARTLLAPDASEVDDLREIGFTTAHVVPEGQMLPGQGAVIQLAGASPSAMFVTGSASTFFQLQGARSSWPNVVAPATDMAVIATMRQMVRETRRRQEVAAAYARAPQGRQRPPTDPVHDALMPVVDGALPMAAYTESVLDIHRMLALQAELDLPMMLMGLNGAFQTVDALRDRDLPLFLTLDLPEMPDAESDTTATDTTNAAMSEADMEEAMTPEGPGSFFADQTRTRSFEDLEDETTQLKARQAQEREKYYRTAAMLREAGLRFGFMTKDVTPGDIRDNLQLMIEHGLSEDDALASLTTDPAALLGLDDRLGTVEAGKIANLVLTDGNYFAEDTAIRFVVVDGQMFEVETAEAEGDVTGSAAAVVGAWEYTIESPQGELSGTITLEESGSGLDGTISSPTGEEEEGLQSISFDGTSLSFSFDGGETGEVSVSVTVDGDTFDGSVSVAQFGSFPITGTRTGTPD